MLSVLRRAGARGHGTAACDLELLMHLPIFWQKLLSRLTVCASESEQ